MPQRARSDLPYLAPSEWQVFYVLSKRGPLTIQEIGRELVGMNPDFKAGYTTLLSYAQRLIRKGYVHQKRLAGPTTAHTYSAVVPFNFALRRQIERFFAEFIFDDPESLRTLRQLAEDHVAVSALTKPRPT